MTLLITSLCYSPLFSNLMTCKRLFANEERRREKRRPFVGRVPNAKKVEIYLLKNWFLPKFSWINPTESLTPLHHALRDPLGLEELRRASEVSPKLLDAW